MYRITADGKLLHDFDPDTVQRLQSGRITEEVNQIPSFVFSLTPDNRLYHALTVRKTILRAVNTRTSETEFEGRVLAAAQEMKSDGRLFKTVTCEGLLGYLCDSIQMHITYENKTPAQFLEAVLAVHNAQTDAEKQIRLGICTVTGNTHSKTTSFRNTWQEIQENLISRIGGEVRLRRGTDGVLYLDYADSFGETSDAVVEVGLNLRSMKIRTDSAGIITRLIPLGAMEGDSGERLTIAGASPDGNIYIDSSEGIAAYGIITGTAEFDDVTLADNLYKRGLAHLAACARQKISYDAQVLDLSQVREKAAGFRAGDTCRFRCRVMGLDEDLRIIRRTVDIFKPYAPQVKIGDKIQSLTDRVI